MLVACTLRHSWQISMLVWNLRWRFSSWASILNSTANWMYYILRFNVNPVNKVNQLIKASNSFLLKGLRENFSTFSFWCKTHVRFRLYQQIAVFRKSFNNIKIKIWKIFAYSRAGLANLFDDHFFYKFRRNSFACPGILKSKMRCLSLP